MLGLLEVLLNFALIRHARLPEVLLNFALIRNARLPEVLLNFALIRHARLPEVLLNFALIRHFLPAHMVLNHKERGHSTLHPSVTQYVFMWCWRSSLESPDPQRFLEELEALL